MDRTPLSLLIVDDSPEDRMSYCRYLSKSSRYECSFEEVGTVADGVAYCEQENVDGVLLDFYLPDGEGLDFLEKTSQFETNPPFFTIIMTGQGSDVLATRALTMGATDYLPKRLADSESLCQAVHSARERQLLRQAVLDEQREKDELIKHLKKALEEVKRLSGLLPICAHCKSIRKDDGYWQQVESYFSEFTGTQFSHGICPDCMVEHFGPEFADLADKSRGEQTSS